MVFVISWACSALMVPTNDKLVSPTAIKIESERSEIYYKHRPQTEISSGNLVATYWEIAAHSAYNMFSKYIYLSSGI